MKVHKIIILIFIVFLNIQTCIANPIPVFVLFNWVSNSTDKIYEYKQNSTIRNKKYVLDNNIIYEYKQNSTIRNKKYVLDNN